MPLVDLVDQLGHHRLDGDGALALAPHPLLGDGEHLAFGEFEQLAGRFAFVVEDGAGDLAARRQQLAQQRALADDGAVRPDVGGRGGIAGQRAQVGQPARVGEPAGAFEVLADGDRIAGPVLARELPDRLEDDAVIGAVEILGAQHVGDVVPRGRIEQQPPQHRLLRLDRMRRRTRRFKLRIFGERGDDLNHEAGNLFESLNYCF